MNSKVTVTRKMLVVMAKLNPRSKKSRPSKRLIGKDNNKWISWRFRVPKHPYKIDAPNRKNPDMKDPEIKYFKPASLENAEFLWNVDRM